MYRRSNRLVSPAVRLVLLRSQSLRHFRSKASISTTFPRLERSIYKINSLNWSKPFLEQVRTFRDSPRILQVPQHTHQRNYSDRGKSPNPAIVRNKKIIELGRKNQWKEILLLHQKEKEGFSNVNYATTMSQLGRIRSVNRKDALFNQFVSDLESQMETKGLSWIGVRQTANIMHALGKMKLKSSSAERIATLVSREENAEWLVNQGAPQAIANTAWAFAKLGAQSPKLFANIETRAEWLVGEAKPQEVANTAWSCATLGVQSPILFAEVERNAEWFVKNGLPQNIANTAWACATLGVQSPKLFAEIEKYSDWFVQKGLPQNIANMAWSCAKLGVQSPKLFANIEKRAEWLLKNGLPQNIANTAWACATLGVQSPNLFAETEKYAEKMICDGTPQNIANTAWAFATIGFDAPNFFNHLDEHIDKLLSTGSAQNIVNTCYAIQILDLGRTYEASLSALWAKVMPIKTTEFRNEEINQLVLVRTLAKAAGIQLQEPFSELLTRMDNVKVDDEQSSYQKDVSAVLDEIGFAHEEEVSPLYDSGTGGLLSIDLACKERKIAVECDGPSHYLRDVDSSNISRVENGSTKAKRCFLERSGWKVVNLNYQDWIAANEKGTTQEWLRQKLTDAGVDWSDKNQITVPKINKMGSLDKDKEVRRKKVDLESEKDSRQTGTNLSVEEWKARAAALEVGKDSSWKDPAANQRLSDLEKLASMGFWKGLRVKDDFHAIVRDVLPDLWESGFEKATKMSIMEKIGVHLEKVHKIAKGELDNTINSTNLMEMSREAKLEVFVKVDATNYLVGQRAANEKQC